MLAIGLVCCIAPARADRRQPIDCGSQVTLAIFSGRRDPTWSLSAVDTDRLITQIQQLKSIPTHKFIQQLGVESWLIRLNRSLDFIVVERGFIEYHRQGISQFFQDPTHKIETQLLQSGKAAVKVGDEHYHLIRSASIPIFTIRNRK